MTILSSYFKLILVNIFLLIIMFQRVTLIFKKNSLMYESYCVKFLAVFLLVVVVFVVYMHLVLPRWLEVERLPRVRVIGVRSPVATDVSRKNK